MEGAVESGIRVALEVLNFIKPQSLTPHELKVVIKWCSLLEYFKFSVLSLSELDTLLDDSVDSKLLGFDISDIPDMINLD